MVIEATLEEAKKRNRNGAEEFFVWAEAIKPYGVYWNWYSWNDADILQDISCGVHEFSGDFE